MSQNEGAPPKRITKEEAALQLVREAQIEAYQRIFEHLKATDPKVAEALGPSFEEFMEAVMETMKEDPKGNMDDILSSEKLSARIKNNPWPSFIREYVKKMEPLSSEEKEKVKKDLAIDVEKRIKGKDIN